MMILAFNLLETSKPDEEMIFSDFITKLQQGEVAEVTIKKPENLMIGTLKNGTKFKSYAPDDPDLIKELREKGVRISSFTIACPSLINCGTTLARNPRKTRTHSR